MIADSHGAASGPLPQSGCPCRSLLARLAPSVSLFASCERFALELGLSDLDLLAWTLPGTAWTSFLEAQTG